jgi:hypothetical protein
MKAVNAYYGLIDKADLNSGEGYHSMIMVCPECGALFSQKACGNRTVFPWFGYHPTDGNCKVVTDEFERVNNSLVNACDCESYPTRLTTKSALNKAIKRVAGVS